MAFKKAKHLMKAGKTRKVKTPKQNKHLVPPTHKQKKQMAVKTPKQVMTQNPARPPQKFSLIPPTFKQKKTMDKEDQKDGGIDEEAEMTARIRKATSKRK